MVLRCLAIGIHNAGAPFEMLNGAVSGAREMYEWAVASGYVAKLLTDEKMPVEIDDVKTALVELLPHGSETERLIIYFAGHGLVDNLEEGLWILNDWKQRRAISMELLRRNLGEFGVRQISIFADACRSIPDNVDLATLEKQGVMPFGFTRPDVAPPVDRFIASQDGRAAFMIYGPTPEEDRCLFSGVLMEGLWGKSDLAFSTRATDKVISQSLGSFLRGRVPEIAKKYGLTVNPNPQPTFPEDADIYFDRRNPPKNIPELPRWPDPPELGALETAVERSAPSEGGGDSNILGSILGGLIGNPSILSLPVDLGGMLGKAGYGSILGGILGAVEPGDEKAPPFPDKPDDIDDSMWESIRAAMVLQSGALDGSPDEQRQLEWLIRRGAEQTREKEAEQSKAAYQQAIADLLRATEPPSDLHEGVVVEGASVKRLWCRSDINLIGSGPKQAWRSHGVVFGSAQQVLIEFDDGQFGSCVIMSGMVTRIVYHDGGVAGLIMQPGYGTDYGEVKASIERTEEVIAKAGAGTLNIEEASDLAIPPRMMKHANPVLGVLSAYIYDGIGDTESIRRMAYFYVQHHQAIPYDIAFLANAQSRMNGKGELEVDIPAVAGRMPRTEREKQFDWTTQNTPAVTGLVAGLNPWMRQGWPYLPSASAQERMMAHNILPLIGAATSARFTTLVAEGGKAMIAQFGLEERR